MSDANARYKRTDNAVMRQVAGEWILVPIAGDIADMTRLITTNDVGASIWSFLASPTTVGDACEKVCDTFDVPRDVALADTSTFIDELLEVALVEAVSD